MAGKIGIVLRTLGQDIIQHHQESGGSFLYPDEEMSEPTKAEDILSYIPTMHSELNSRPEGDEWGNIGEIIPASTRRIGMHFDGLSRGMHMEIKYDDEKSELSLTHKGYLSYRESMGEIDVYVPNKEWEEWVDKLWVFSKSIQRKLKEEEFNKKAAESKEAKESWLYSLMAKWGKI